MKWTHLFPAIALIGAVDFVEKAQAQASKKKPIPISNKGNTSGVKVEEVPKACQIYVTAYRNINNVPKNKIFLLDAYGTSVVKEWTVVGDQKPINGIAAFPGRRLQGSADQKQYEITLFSDGTATLGSSAVQSDDGGAFLNSSTYFATRASSTIKKINVDINQSTPVNTSAGFMNLDLAIRKKNNMPTLYGARLQNGKTVISQIKMSSNGFSDIFQTDEYLTGLATLPNNNLLGLRESGVTFEINPDAGESFISKMSTLGLSGYRGFDLASTSFNCQFECHLYALENRQGASKIHKLNTSSYESMKNWYIKWASPSNIPLPEVKGLAASTNGDMVAVVRGGWGKIYLGVDNTAGLDPIASPGSDGGDFFHSGTHFLDVVNQFAPQKPLFFKINPSDASSILHFSGPEGFDVKDIAIRGSLTYFTASPQSIGGPPSSTSFLYVRDGNDVITQIGEFGMVMNGLAWMNNKLFALSSSGMIYEVDPQNAQLSGGVSVFSGAGADLAVKCH